MKPAFRKLFVALSSSVAAICAMALPASASAQPLTGVYRGEVYSSPNAVNAYSSWLGYDVTLGQGHQAKDSWANIENPTWQLNSWSNWVKAKPGRRLNYSVAMFPSGQGSLSQCAQGSYDFRFRNLANNMAAAGLQRSIIRLGWEFSGNWMPWYSGNGQQANFAACFRRIVTAMRDAQPSAGFEFDWNPNYDIPASDLSTTYPGDAYVDYIGFDLYDQGWNGAYPIPSGCTGSCALTRWRSVWNNQFAPALTRFRDFAQSHGKRLSVPEWGVNDPATTGGGDNTYYVQQMLSFIFDPANNVGYHSYFDYQASDGHHQLSDVDGSGGRTFQTEFPNSAALFKSHFAGLPSGSVTATKAVTNPSSVAQGGSLQVSSSVTSSTARTLIVKFELRNSTSLALLAAQTYSAQAFTAGQMRAYSPSFTIAASAATGTYRVDTLVLSGDGSDTLVHRTDTTFSVTAAPIPTTVSAGKATVSPAAVTRGQAFAVSGSVTSPTARTLVVKYEIRTTASPYTMVASQSYTAQAFTAGQTRTYTPSFTIPTSAAAGTYRVDTLIYTSDWSQTLVYRNDTTFTVN
ncbi:glycosyl hydrolase [Archangium sp. Cb G35]|uniref:glycosyl hydrolase n=1 Tax=Archangium sp. Cb G35 TaxID=1920190 RepID=UPI000B260620|nr:glycosyl hydrolase [Archangium sp. Cb G35]